MNAISLRLTFEWLKDIKNQRNLLAGILFVIIFFSFKNCNNQQTIQNTYDQNIAALIDSIRSYETENGDLIYQKSAFISENGSLKNLNRELSDEVKWLKDNPIVIVKTKTVIKSDTIKVPIETTYPGNWNGRIFTQNFNWKVDREYSEGNYRRMIGDFDVSVDTNYLLSISPLRLTSDELGIAFTTGLTENKNGLLEIFVKSDYPGFKPTSLDGALIDPSKSKVLKKYFPPKRLGLGIYGGYGLYGDLQNNQIGRGIQIGVGIQYNLIQWNFKK